MGCGSPGGAKKTAEEPENQDGIEIIHENNSQAERQNEAACEPHQIKRVPPTQKQTLGHEDVKAVNPYHDQLQVFNHKECHILVVDDDQRERELIVEWFKEAQFKVTSLENGEDVRAMIERMSAGLAEGEKVKDLDLVLMDLHMSSDYSNVLDKFVTNSHYAHIPVVVSGGEVSTQQAERMIRRGAADFMFKPMSRALILKTVRHLLQNIVEMENTLTLKNIGDKYKEQYISKVKNKPQKAFSSTVSFSKKDLEKLVEESDHLASIPKAHVVVIDAALDTTDRLSSWLGRKYEVTVYNDGQAASNYLHELQRSVEPKAPDSDERNPVDLILSESELHGPVSGLDLVELLSKHPATHNVPVILMSSDDASTTEMTHSIRMGCENYVTKPLSRDVTIKKVDTVLLSIAQHNLAKQYMERAQKYEKLLNAPETVPEN